MNSYLEWEFDVINDFKYKLSLDANHTEEQLENLTNKYGEATSQTLGIEIQINDKKETNALVVNDAKDYLKYTDHNKRYMTLIDNLVKYVVKLLW